MDSLVTACEAAAEAVKAAKAATPGPENAAAIKEKVAALMAVKEQITKLDPAHPLAIVDKKAAKKKAAAAKKAAPAAAQAAAPADGAKGPSKNAQKAAAKKALKDAKKKGHKAAAPAAAAPSAPTTGFALRPGASATARAKIAAVAKACKVTVATGPAAPYAPAPPDGCVLDSPEGPVGGAANACRLLAFASSAFSATPAADGWCDWSGRQDPEKQGKAVLDHVEQALAKNDPGLAPGTVARMLVACDCKIALKTAKGTPLATALANEVSEEKPWAPLKDESTLEFVTRLFAEAIKRAAPSLRDQDPVVQRCAVAAFGDYQCNAPMGIFKALKGQGHTTLTSPRAVGAAIADNLPPNVVLVSAVVAPAGFVNATIDTGIMSEYCRTVAQDGKAPPPPIQAFGGRRTVLVDFSSPNIAKEMHVGHLRSTIIGDTICRVLEYCGHDVKRVNHVGDWGTQFGMLISHMEEAYPDFVSNPPNITDLTVFYKNAKQRFDEDEAFKKKARATVVQLQAGDPRCREIWALLCDISRKEFAKVYKRLGVTLTEVGESHYNGMIPNAIALLEEKGLTTNSDGATTVFLEGHSFPLIVKKSDGGFGYDSTDIAAIHHRLKTLNVDWVVYVTDLGQAEHFHMCFEAAQKAGWTAKDGRLCHVGFGVVQGEDGKRFKTRSGATVRLVDLLDESVTRMEASLLARVEEGKCQLSPEDVKSASHKIGYGAVKYADLQNHPQTNYKFSYDKMLSTQGNTAVYLLFAHARLVSIVRKAAAKGVDPKSTQALDLCAHAKERALAFELTQFAGVVASVAEEFLPVRVCDYLYKVSTKFTEFVTECKVLDDPRMKERVVLCEATGVVMRACFDLLGIEYLMQI